MPDQLKPGGMGKASDPLNAKPSDFANSMADAMDSAFHALLAAEGMSSFEVNTNSKEARDRRRIFVAIAQGVVRHLKDHGKALTVVNTLNNPTGETIQVQVDTTLI
jgi:hypothetical protein